MIFESFLQLFPRINIFKFPLIYAIDLLLLIESQDKSIILLIFNIDFALILYLKKLS
jgi:hypothetical protein